MYKAILVPLDGSEVAASILEQVVALGHGYGARVILLTVGQPCPTEGTCTSDMRLSMTFQAEAYLGRVRRFFEVRGLEVTTMVCIGEPACEILDCAERQEVDLIIINSRGGGETPAPFLGSVAEKVARASAIPVLVLHTPRGERESGDVGDTTSSPA